jgi:hypothetical protein
VQFWNPGTILSRFQAKMKIHVKRKANEMLRLNSENLASYFKGKELAFPKINLIELELEEELPSGQIVLKTKCMFPVRNF